MDRLDIEYDFLPRESEILHLHFWDAAFTKLKEAGVLTYESEGKNKGCWVMRRAGTAKSEAAEDAEDIAEDAERNTESENLRGRPESHRPLQRHGRLRRQRHRLPHVEVRPARPRFQLSQILPLSQSARLLDFDHARRSRRRERSSPLRRRRRNLQRHRRPPVRSAEHGHRSAARPRPRRSRRPLYAFFLRDGRPHSALRRRTRLRIERRRESAPVDRGLRPQRFRRQGRRPARRSDRLRPQGSRLAPSRAKRPRARQPSPRKSPSARCATSCSSSPSPR